MNARHGLVAASPLLRKLSVEPGQGFLNRVADDAAAVIADLDAATAARDDLLAAIRAHVRVCGPLANNLRALIERHEGNQP